MAIIITHQITVRQQELPHQPASQQDLHLRRRGHLPHHQPVCLKDLLHQRDHQPQTILLPDQDQWDLPLQRDHLHQTILLPDQDQRDPVLWVAEAEEEGKEVKNIILF
jgi:hypothetical protein